MKNMIHWIGAVGTVILGALLAFLRILPVEHEIIFIGALFLLWEGLSYLCGIYENPRYPRKARNLWGGLQVLVGACWLAMSMSASPNMPLWAVILVAPAIVFHMVQIRMYRIP